MSPHVVSIHIARAARAPMVRVEHAVAVAGLGLDGDRYADGVGAASTWPGDHELTLIEAEAIEAIAAETGIQLADGETRRNLTTSGVVLLDLIGRRFRLGEVLCEGTRPCHPCAYLECLTARRGLTRALAYRSGIHARILVDGVIFEGDEIVVL